MGLETKIDNGGMGGRMTGARVYAVLLAAGMSTRMGQPKLLLPWGQGAAGTVIGAVTGHLLAAGVAGVIVVTGAGRAAMEAALAHAPRVECVYNPRYADGEPLHSFQTGLAALPDDWDALLFALGDQPHVPPAAIARVLAGYDPRGAGLVIPSVNERRAHPWLADRRYAAELAALTPPATLRDFIRRHADAIRYVVLEESSMLEDIDTPEDYARLRQQWQARQ